MWQLKDPDPARRFPNNFLDAGARIGLVGGSDHSRGFTRGYGLNRYCLTGFWVTEPTAQAVFDALRERRTFATANAKIAVHTTLNNIPAGGQMTVAGAVRVKANVSSAHQLEQIYLIRDGGLLTATELQTTTACLELVDENPPPGPHWYVLTAAGRAPLPGAGAVAHSSPFFVNVIS